MPKTVRLLAILALGLVGIALVAACGGEEEAVVPQVAVGASEYAFTTPESFAGGGLVQVKLNNTGKETHHAQFVRLNDGVTLAQFQQALQEAAAAQFQGPAVGKVFAAVTFQEVPASTAPGKSSEVSLSLAQGSYVMLCFLPDPQGVPHVAKGMIKPFNVTTAAATQPTLPKAAGTVELNDYAFTTIPSDLKVGKHTWAVTNKGKEIHEMDPLLLKAPAAQIQQILAASPPAPRLDSACWSSTV